MIKLGFQISLVKPLMPKFPKVFSSNNLICRTLLGAFLLFSCVNTQTVDIKKSANYKIGEYNVLVNSPRGYCINEFQQRENKKNFQLILTECVDKSSGSNLNRRPVSSIISVNVFYDPSLKFFPTILDLVDNAGGNKSLQAIFNEKGTKIKQSFVKNEVLFLSLERANYEPSLDTGRKFWKALTLNDGILIVFSSYGFSKNSKNRSAQRVLENKLKSIIDGVTVVKYDLEKSY